MNAMDILGGLIKRRAGTQSGGSSSSGGGLGGAILKSILKGARGGSPAPAGGDPKPQRPSGSPRIRPSRRDTSVNSLDDLLRQAHDRHDRRSSGSGYQQPRYEESVSQRQRELTAEYDGNPEPLNEQAEILVRAMINASKADGSIDENEQAAIIKQLGELSQDEVQFLRQEFARPLDVKEYTWSVPVGMEQQVYAVSLMAIRLDEQSEARYLRDLAHGLRLSQDQVDDLHRQFRQPAVR